MQHAANSMVHVPTQLGDSQVAESWRVQGRPATYTHPQAVSRYAIGSAPGRSPAVATRYNGVGHE